MDKLNRNEEIIKTYKGLLNNISESIEEDRKIMIDRFNGVYVYYEPTYEKLKNSYSKLNLDLDIKEPRYDYDRMMKIYNNTMDIIKFVVGDDKNKYNTHFDLDRNIQMYHLDIDTFERIFQFSE